MRAWLTFTMCLAAALPALPQRQAGEIGDESAIREIVKKYVDARERRDEKALQALFTEDADQLTSSGEWRRGRNAIVQGTLASSDRTGGTRAITIDRVRVPVPGVALADGRYDITGLQGGGGRRMLTTFLLTRHSDGWRVAAIRNMLPAAPVPASSPPR